MNERIKLLAEQANTIGDWGEDITEGRYFVYPNIKNLEKFAELIVRECAKVCRDQTNVYALKADRDNCAIAIEEHFGVEE